MKLPTRMALLALLSSGKIRVTDTAINEFSHAISCVVEDQEKIQIALDELNQSKITIRTRSDESIFSRFMAILKKNVFRLYTKNSSRSFVDPKYYL
jgi:hypothetical protein